MNFDDLELLLITKKDLSYNELIKIGLLLYDEVSYLEGMNISRRSEFVEQANMFKKNVLKLVGDNEYILN